MDCTKLINGGARIASFSATSIRSMPQKCEVVLGQSNFGKNPLGHIFVAYSPSLTNFISKLTVLKINFYAIIISSAGLFCEI
jgi:hypothetical protein